MTEHTQEEAKTKEVAKMPDVPLVDGRFMPTNYGHMWTLAGTVFRAGVCAKGVDTQAKAMIVLAQGFELGISMMQAVSSIGVINGKPVLYGDTPLALVRRSGLLEYFEEREEGAWDNKDLLCSCIVKRKGDGAKVGRSFGYKKAQRANLVGKSGPWTTYPERMCQMRARAWALRDVFGDILSGITLEADVDETPEAVVVSRVTEAPPEEISQDTVRTMQEVAVETQVSGPANGKAGLLRKTLGDPVAFAHGRTDDRHLTKSERDEIADAEADRPEKDAAGNKDPEAFIDVTVSDPAADSEYRVTYVRQENGTYIYNSAGVVVRVESADQVRAKGADLYLKAKADMDALKAKTEEKPAPAEKKDDGLSAGHPWAYDNWYKKRGGNGVNTGFVAYVAGNLKTLRQVDEDVQDAVRKKWVDLYGDKPFPLDVAPAPAEDTTHQDSDGAQEEIKAPPEPEGAPNAQDPYERIERFATVSQLDPEACTKYFEKQVGAQRGHTDLAHTVDNLLKSPLSVIQAVRDFAAFGGDDSKSLYREVVSLKTIEPDLYQDAIRNLMLNDKISTDNISMMNPVELRAVQAEVSSLVDLRNSLG
jgi:hypothetical protein